MSFLESFRDCFEVGLDFFPDIYEFGARDVRFGSNVYELIGAN